MTVWVNQSGNGFAPPVVIPGTPSTSSLTEVRLTDLYGAGVPGIVWSGIGRASRYAFLDLTGSVKPYLLTGIDNHAGATTTMTYATSTPFATADRTAGHPWRTTLPFPVHVVAAVTTRDAFAGSFSPAHSATTTATGTPATGSSADSLGSTTPTL